MDEVPTAFEQVDTTAARRELHTGEEIGWVSRAAVLSNYSLGASQARPGNVSLHSTVLLSRRETG